MSRIRQQNVFAAQWTPNGGALGAPDLTAADNQLFGANVFSPAVQRQRLPKDVYRKLSQTLARGEALDTSLADAVALAMKEWALGEGRDPLHALVSAADRARPPRSTTASTARPARARHWPSSRARS